MKLTMARRAGNEKIFAVIYWKTIKNKSVEST